MTYENFRDDILSSIGHRPPDVDENGLPLYSLDRVDNDRGYEPGNVRWADRVTQGLNRHHGTFGYDPNSKWGQQRAAGLCGMYGCKSPPDNNRTLCAHHANSRRKNSTEWMRRHRAKKRMSNTDSSD